MGKRRQNKHELEKQYPKRPKISIESEQEANKYEIETPDGFNKSFRIQQKDRVERKVDIIVKDIEDNCHRSLTIWGTGLGVEKTIAVVEELKRNYMKRGTRYTQETSIKAGDNNEPHLQVVLTPLSANINLES